MMFRGKHQGIHGLVEWGVIFQIQPLGIFLASSLLQGTELRVETQRAADSTATVNFSLSNVLQFVTAEVFAYGLLNLSPVSRESPVTMINFRLSGWGPWSITFSLVGDLQSMFSWPPLNPSTMFNRSVESGHLYLFPRLMGEESVQYSIIRYGVGCRFSLDLFISLRTFYSQFTEIF